MTDRELKIMDATMDIVAEVGLEGFSMRTLSSRVELSAPMIYLLFPSKEDLLYRCFLFVNRQIAGLFKATDLSPEASPEEILAYFHSAWLRYFRFMVEKGNRTLFYYAYRDSAWLKDILRQNNETVAQDMAAFTQLCQIISAKLGLFRSLSPDFFYVFLLDGTGCFVRRIIQQKLVLTDAEAESIWQLIFGGIHGFIA